MISLILFFLAGIVDAARDFVGFRLEQSIFYKYNPQFWNTDKSWKNKYKDGDPLKGEKFFLSKSLFVGVTDAWHFFKLLRTLFIFVGIYFLLIPCGLKSECLLFVIIARVLFGLSFTFFYDLFDD